MAFSRDMSKESSVVTKNFTVVETEDNSTDSSEEERVSPVAIIPSLKVPSKYLSLMFFPWFCNRISLWSVRAHSNLPPSLLNSDSG